jgi:hypothetical protein
MADTTTKTGYNPIHITGTTDVDSTVFDGGGISLMKIKHLYWFNPTTAGHLCTLKDGNGNFIAELRAEANNQSERLTVGAAYGKVVLTDLDSGKLYIYL